MTKQKIDFIEEMKKKKENFYGITYFAIINTFSINVKMIKYIFIVKNNGHCQKEDKQKDKRRKLCKLYNHNEMFSVFWGVYFSSDKLA